MNKNRVFLTILFLVAYFWVQPVWSQTPTPTVTQQQILSLFRSVAFLGNLGLTVPTIIETPINVINEQSVAVVEVETNIRQPVAFVTKTAETPNNATLKSSGYNLLELTDNNTSTFFEFQPNEDENGSAGNIVEVNLKYKNPITTTQFVFDLDQNAPLPQYIAVYAIQNGRRLTIMADQRVSSTNILFPQYTASEFEIVFKYTQPLRLTEIGFIENQPTYTSQFLRFLARPNFSYQIYKDADGNVPYQYIPEAGNLYEEDANIKSVTIVNFVSNPAYIPADQDRDGIIDGSDNCVSTANPEQQDENKNSIGDACEDFDLDGIINSVDNCPDNPNNRQQDEDADGLGDHCDGEESRLVEQLGFLPWLGIGLGFGVVILLFKFTMQHEDKKDQTVGTSSESKNFQKK